ncbi:MAG TPA: ATP-binding protein [Acidimicrobiales bacterium]|nr:ATP-binding protein [Acidimicrobiales bacterium]
MPTDGPGASDVPDADLATLARGLAAVLGRLHEFLEPQSANSLVAALGDHLGVDPTGLPVVTHELPSYQLIDAQVSIDVWAAEPGRTMRVLGMSGAQRRFHPLSEILSGTVGPVGIGPVDYVDAADGPDSTRSCVTFGLFLLDDGGQRSVALLRGADTHGPMRAAMLELLAADGAVSRAVLGELRRLAVRHSVLRGQVLAFGPGEGGEYGALHFMARPELRRAELVLPEATLAQIERHVVGIAEHAPRLRAAGQHLKRGVLLYGPPGTGKTHTIRYLLAQRPGVTAFVLSGQALAAIGQACALARTMQPSLVILEDVDLIAADRSFGAMGPHPLLFEVLNQIDGLGDDVDVTFVLTTNRVDILERALAERPGRVDAAVEIAPPDAEGRARLLRLYGAALGVGDLDDAALADAVAATEGKTATYLREVVRRAALVDAGRADDRPLRLDGATLAQAAAELLDDRAALTRSLLGGPDEPDAEPPLGPAGGFVGQTMGPGMHAFMLRRFQRGPGGATPFGDDG